ncbi:MAG: hypothetical protein JWO86_7458 [Myxococcaceae bacterium]|nr:hypothetical protein [Myxococcaceae bacterium]
MNTHKSRGNGTGIVIARRQDIAPDVPSHVPGVEEGNWPPARHRRRIERGKDEAVTGEARRSTGISASEHGTIDPRMPKLTPP